LIKPNGKHLQKEVKIHRHKRIHESPVQTEGRLIRWATLYDGFANIMTQGHIRRLRTLTVDQALLKTILAKQRVGKTGERSGIDPAPEMIAIARRRHAVHTQAWTVQTRY
jgi:ubiquinone/menaquinone biosynthesis C-methylase UbiE